MTADEARAAVAEIARHAGDNEVAHIAEDNLRTRVLRAIAEGTAEDPRQLAAIALSTEALDFERWYA